MSKVAKVVGAVIGGVAMLGVVGSFSDGQTKSAVGADRPFTAVPSESAHPDQTPHIKTKLAWADEATGYTVIKPGSAADHYLTAHWDCEGSLRVQFVNGYTGPSEKDQPLWKYMCRGVSDSERDSMVQAAVMWGSSHPNG